MTSPTTPAPDPEAEPGARLSGEPSAAFAAFIVFRDLGPARTVRRAYRQHAGNAEATHGQASGCWNAWAKEWRWRERAEEWDRHVDREARLAQVEAVKEMNRRQIQFFRALQIKGLQALAKLEPEEMTAQDVVRCLVEGSKGERLALGQVTEAVRSEQAGASTVTLEVVERIVPTRGDNADALPSATGGSDARLAPSGELPPALRSPDEIVDNGTGDPAQFELPDELPRPRRL